MSGTSEHAVWVDGRVVPAGAPAILPLDRGVTVGDGVFETTAVVHGRALALTRHLRRLVRSAHALGLGEPDHVLIRSGVEETLRAAPGAGRLRITVTAGPDALGAARAGTGQTVMVAAGPATPAEEIAAVLLPWVRNERSPVAGIKTTSYVENVVALAEARRRGADEGLLGNTVGDLCEGTASNVLVETGGEVLTPALSSGCLPGITRGLVLEWGEAAGLPVREARPGELPLAVLDRHGAALAVTGSVRGIVPVGVLNGRRLPQGPLIHGLREVYAARMLADIDP